MANRISWSSSFPELKSFNSWHGVLSFCVFNFFFLLFFLFQHVLPWCTLSPSSILSAIKKGDFVDPPVLCIIAESKFSPKTASISFTFPIARCRPVKSILVSEANFLRFSAKCFPASRASINGEKSCTKAIRAAGSIWINSFPPKNILSGFLQLWSHSGNILCSIINTALMINRSLITSSQTKTTLNLSSDTEELSV